MSTRQYVGARYVPKFSSPIEWDKNRGYEALEIVTYLGTSYTSKKAVPVGTEIDNGEYWVVTGNYNAQVEFYRQETEKVSEGLSNEINERKNSDTNFNNRLTFIENNDAIIIADSYGVNSVVGNNNWCNQLSSAIIKRFGENVNVRISAHGSRGFVPNNMVTETFLDNLKEFDSLTVEEKNKIKYIIVCGGANDVDQSVETIENKISDFIKYAKENYVNATVYIGMIGYKINPVKLYLNPLQGYLKCTKYGGVYLNGVENCLRLTMLQDDGVHPNSVGCEEIGKGVIQSFFTGACDIIRYVNDITITPSGICTEIRQLGKVIEEQYNNTSRLMIKSNDYNNRIVFVINKKTWDSKTVEEIGILHGVLTGNDTIGHGQGYVTHCYFRDATTLNPIANSNMMCQLWVGESDNKLYFCPLGNPTPENFFGETINNAGQIVIDDCCLRNGNSFVAL